jgi:hypothetical protein
MRGPKLCQVTLPGLDVRYDWRVVHDRLLDEFSEVNDVLATTIRGTLLIVYEGPAEADAWLQAISETILNFRYGVSTREPSREPNRVAG